MSTNTNNIFSRIITFSVYNPISVILVTLLVLVFGWISFNQMSIDAVPDITNKQVQVNTPIKGLIPEDIERFITYPIETSMGGLQGVTQVRSLSRFGLSQVTVVFSDDMDIYLARQLVSEKLASIKASLPAEISPSLGPVTTGLGEVVHYTIEAKNPAKDPELRKTQLFQTKIIQDWTVKPRLLTVSGISEVNTIGGFEKQIVITPDSEKMSRLNIHFNDIEDALKRANRNVGGSYIQLAGEQILIQAQGLVKTIDDIKDIPLDRLSNLDPISIGDIANVSIGQEIRTGSALVNGKEAVLGTALMLSGADSRVVSKEAVEKLEEISKSIPQNFEVKILYDRSKLIDNTTNTVSKNLIFGAVLVIIVLLVLIGNLRAALIVALTIPFSLLMTFIFMKSLNISGNLMSLGALDFGLIVDGAVIVMDNCIRFIQKKRREVGRDLTKEEVKRNIVQATSEIRSAAGFGEMIIILVFLPILALTGIEGKMFHPMALTFCFALISALILSFTTVPALASIFLNGKTSEKEPYLILKLKSYYEPILSFWIDKWKYLTGGALFLLVISFILFSRLGGEFIPQLKEGAFVFQFIRPTQISLDASIQMQQISDELIKEFSEVENVFTRIGTSEIATDPMGVNLTDTYVTLKDRSEWPLANGEKRDYNELASLIRKRLLEEVPGQRVMQSQPIQMRFNELLEGTRADISIKIFGEDQETLMELSEKVARIVSQVEGAGEVEAEVKGKSPLLSIEPITSELKALSIPPSEVLETVEISMAGKTISYFYDNQIRYPLVLRLAEDSRTDIDILKTLPVGMQGRGSIELEQVAKLNIKDSYSVINREHAQRRSAVLVNPNGDVETFVNEAKSKLTKDLRLPEGYYLEWGGSFKNLIEAKKRLSVAAPIAMLIIVFMVFTTLGTFWETFLVLCCVPFALIGGVFGLVLNDLNFSISAGIGFIALSGIAVLNGLVLIKFFKQKEELGLTGKEMIIKGSLTRLRPVLMTAITDILGFLPMMLTTGYGAEVQKPIAAVIVGGVFSSTFLTLIILPSLYNFIKVRKKMETPKELLE